MSTVVRLAYDAEASREIAIAHRQFVCEAHGTHAGQDQNAIQNLPFQGDDLFPFGRYGRCVVA